jgi:TolB-like protein/Tfp pilus assembly protein PilF
VVTPATGERLGHFEILAPLGAGGMGVVYRARDTRLGREVALKVLPEAFARDPGRLSRFEREARVLATLSHPGIAAIHGLEPSGDGPVLVMELVEGDGLDQRLARGRIPVRQALELARQMAVALESAHAKGIVHRDLKPSNIKVTPEGQVKLLDFGLAKALAPGGDGASPSGDSTATGVVGTAPYMSPEQARAEGVDRRTDVWSLGCVLYEMLSGGRAFPGHTAEAVAGVLEREPVWEALPGETPAKVVDLLHRCLRKDRNRRLHDIADARIELEEALSGVSRPRFSRKRRLALTLGVVAGLSLAVVATKDRLQEWLRGGPGAEGIESLAVLPLENRSGDPDQEYLTDGMTEALISALGRVEALRVISYTSAMQYKGVRKPLPDIARELDVEAVVEGSVLRVGQRVRITARLIGAVPERQLWTDSYDRELGDILGLSSEVARAISHEIQITLTAEDDARLAARRPVDPEVQEGYLRGRHFLNQHSVEGNRKSLEYFQRAIDKDPHFAPGYAGMAEYYVHVLDYAKAKAASLRALELDDTLAEAHTARAQVAIHSEWDWETADKELKRALELNPADQGALMVSAVLLYVEGRVDEAIEKSRIALDLDPLSPDLADDLASGYAAAGRYDEAIEQCRRTLEIHPHRSYTLAWLGYAHLGKGAYAEALPILERAHTLAGGYKFQTVILARAYAMVGRADDARRLLAQIGSPYGRAGIQTALGDNEEAFASLREAFGKHDYAVVWLKTDPAFDPLRSDPRFQDLLRQLNLPE